MWAEPRVTALILTYHGVAERAGPLFVETELFRTHMDCIVESGATVLGVTELRRTLSSDSLEKPAVAITFDDGLASVVLEAAPILQERGLIATVFCVGGYLGGASNWPSRRIDAPVRELASARDLEELARAGWEIGSHGMEHTPLVGSDENELDREIVRSRDALEQAIGVPVHSFAYPYGAGPTKAAHALVRETYTAGCSTALGYAAPHADPWLLPRIDAHYVRRPGVLRAALDGTLTAYLAARGAVARLRRLVRTDYDLARSG